MDMAKKIDFSIVLPTYSGVNTIQHTLDSILTQKTKQNFEIVYVIDGPNDDLRKIVDDSRPMFEDKGIPVTIKQFKKNKGRFIARIEGAKLARSDQILFVDDRIELDKGYLEELLSTNSTVSMPSVIEVEEHKRPISLTLRSVRRKLYPNRWGEEFDDYYIDDKNFEDSPKGAAALWMPKSLFIEACDEVSRTQGGSGRYTNEDTRVLKYVVDTGHRILRTSKLRIFYRPRAAFKEEVKHLYGRGPRFIDYYLRPGTRFFGPLIAFYITLIAAIVLLVLLPQLFLLLLIISAVGLLLFTMYLAGISRDAPMVFVGLILIVVAFGSGLLKGAYLKFTKGL
jgi:glycosyltransferase involved in cell wall biosynthesis